ALPEEHELVSRLQRFRKKRNTTVYESVGTVGEAEVRDMIAFAPVYVEMIRERLSREVQRLLEEDDWRERRPPRRRARGLAQSITPPSFQPMMRQRPSISRIVHVTVSTSE
ncbi:MAG: hypothetical protein Q8M55_02425, partial [Actinomycetota bacterium]|nr:hypothetical protein [Actinomycetota bacterium]